MIKLIKQIKDLFEPTWINDMTSEQVSKTCRWYSLPSLLVYELQVPNTLSFTLYTV